MAARSNALIFGVGLVGLALAAAAGAESQSKKPTRNLQVGMTGDDVREWQRFLRTQGYDVAIDGVYGPKTQQATAAWQGAHGLQPDGIVGPKTRAAMGTPAKSSTVPASSKPSTAPSSGKPSPAPAPTPKPPVEPPQQVGDRITMAIASGNPAVMRALADDLDREGYPLQAQSLRRVADTYAAAIAAGEVMSPIPPSVVINPQPGPTVWVPPGGVQKTPGLYNKPPPESIARPPTQSMTVPPIVAPPPAQSVVSPNVATTASIPVQMPEQPTNARILKAGATGEDVREWQLFLGAHGYAIKADGVYGSRTTEATAAWQAARGLQADGIVGPKTRASMGSPALPIQPTTWPTLRQGMAGQHVREWQMVLVRDGKLAAANVTGTFDAATHQATRAWQRSNGLGDDGIVGPKTRERITQPVQLMSGDVDGSEDGDQLSGDLSTMVEPRAATPLPGIVPLMDPTPGPPPDRALASRLAVHLLNNKPGTEDKELVREFQIQEGQKDTGMYGPAVGLALAKRYGIVPPAVYYWTETGRARAKRRYREELMILSRTDPQRADEWAAAARFR